MNKMKLFLLFLILLLSLLLLLVVVKGIFFLSGRGTLVDIVDIVRGSAEFEYGCGMHALGHFGSLGNKNECVKEMERVIKRRVLFQREIRRQRGTSTKDVNEVDWSHEVTKVRAMNDSKLRK